MATNSELMNIAREKGLDVTDDAGTDELLALLDPMNDLPPELARVVLDVGDKLVECDREIGEKG